MTLLARTLLRAFVVGAIVVFPNALRAQGEQHASRAMLSERIQRLSVELASPKINKSRKQQLVQEKEAIELRLAEGDFRVGDRFAYTVVRDSARSDTASVREGLVVAIAALEDLSLKGVLRAELNDRLSEHVNRFFRRVTVRSNILTRVAVLGQVRSPGFYYVSPDRPLSELVMVAGGPGEAAKLSELVVKRGGATVVSQKEGKRAIKEGSTLEQVDVRSGDEVFVPMKRRVNWTTIVQLLFVVSSLFFAFLQFLQWYWSRQE